MDCKECKKICCKELPVAMSMEEYKAISDKIPKKKIKIFGNTVYIIPPCPLLDKDNKCIVYELRPIVCRKYPICIIPSPDKQRIVLFFDKDCPQNNNITKTETVKMIQFQIMSLCNQINETIHGDIKDLKAHDTFLDSLGLYRNKEWMEVHGIPIPLITFEELFLNIYKSMYGMEEFVKMIENLPMPITQLLIVFLS